MQERVITISAWFVLLTTRTFDSYSGCAFRDNRSAHAVDIQEPSVHYSELVVSDERRAGYPGKRRVVGQKCAAVLL